jgi:hypothetical protein
VATIQQEKKRQAHQTRIRFLDQAAMAAPLIGDKSNERDHYRDREMQAQDSGSYGTVPGSNGSSMHCAETEETRKERDLHFSCLIA